MLRPPSHAPSILPLAALVVASLAPRAQDAGAPSQDGFEQTARPFLAQHCAHCHGAERSRARFEVHDLDGRISEGRDVERWEKVLEMVRLGEMPPEDEPRPDPEERARVVDWIARELGAIGRGLDAGQLALPSHANRVPHEALFSGEHTGPSASPPRLWRKSAPIYRRLSEELRVELAQPFLGVGGRGIQDYASLLADEATIQTMLRNGKLIAASLMDEPRARLRFLFEEGAEPGDEEVERGVRTLFQLLLQREPTDGDRARYVEGLLEPTRALGDLRLAFETLVQGLLLSPEFVFRMELGLGEELPDGRRRLDPMETAHALSYAFFDRPDRDLLQAAREGRLGTREDVEREVRAVLAREDPRRRYWHYPMEHRWGDDHYRVRPRVLRFFQEFFGYAAANDVFKDRERNPDHHAHRLRKDADFLVLRVLERDERVLETLLTTREYPVDPFFDDRLAKTLGGTNQRAIDHLRTKYGRAFDGIAEGGKWPGIDSRHVSAYDLSRAAADALRRDPGEPLAVPADRRAGLLTHPAWLVAHSGNFDNDPIRRGKWIRERLLAGVVPEVPIGVDARIPEDPSSTLRERMAVTRVDECWRCHKHMDPLGLAFEGFDDFGRSRDRIVLGDADAFYREERKVREQRERWGREMRDWLEQTPTDWEAKARHAEEKLAALVEPAADAENRPEQLRRYENDRRRWTGELERWGSMDEAKRAEKVEHLRGRLDGLVDPVPEAKPVDARGELRGTGDPELDGPVEDAVDLVERLARSDRARQSFVRHAFRYWMGRNETLHDSPTLIAADRAYLESGGSFRELLVSLLTSDSFLLRRDPRSDGEHP